LTDETATNPTPENTTPAPEVANTPTNETEVSITDDQIEGDQVEAVEETEEVDWEDGKKYAVPKALKDALLRQADYTRKTQEVAAQRKELEGRQEAIRQHAEWQQANIKEYARLEAITDRLSQFQGVNWAQLNQDDPVRAQALFIEKSNLEGAQRELREGLTQKQQQALWMQQQETAKQLQEGRAAIAKAIPNFTPELAKSLKDHGTSYGYTADELNAVVDPRAVQVLHDAYLWRQYQSKQRAAVAPKPAPQAEPVRQVTGRKPTQPGLRDDLSAAEWVKRRNAQLGIKA